MEILRSAYLAIAGWTFGAALVCLARRRTRREWGALVFSTLGFAFAFVASSTVGLALGRLLLAVLLAVLVAANIRSIGQEIDRNRR